MCIVFLAIFAVYLLVPRSKIPNSHTHSLHWDSNSSSFASNFLPLRSRRVVSLLSTINVYFFVMEFASFLSQTNGFGCGIFVFGCFSQFLNFVFLCCLLLLGLKFLFFKGSSLFVQYLEKINPNCNSFDREHKDCNNNNNGFVSKSVIDGLDQKKPIILHWGSDSTDGLRCENCDLLLVIRDGLDQIKNRDSTVALSETEFEEISNHSEEDEWSRSNEDEVFDVITLRKMVKRQRKRGDRMELELEKERKAAKSAAEEAMAMFLKLQIEKSVVEMEAKQYKRVAEQRHIYDQEVIQSLQSMLMKLDEEENMIQD